MGPKLGILTGISYVSGVDYFRGIHERVLAATPTGHVMSPNPPMMMASVNCDDYAHYLNTGALDKVDDHLLAGVGDLVAGGCNLLVIASNTGHICVPAVQTAYPHLEVLHIADCSAFELKRQGFTRVGLIGTKPTMEWDYLHARLRTHGIATIVPDDQAQRDEIYRIIYEELSVNEFREEARATMVDAIRDMSARGAEACILGCTEIELLLQQHHMPDFPLIPSAEIHIREAADVLLGDRHLDELLPS